MQPANRRSSKAFSRRGSEFETRRSSSRQPCEASLSVCKGPEAGENNIAEWVKVNLRSSCGTLKNIREFLIPPFSPVALGKNSGTGCM